MLPKQLLLLENIFGMADMRVVSQPLFFPRSMSSQAEISPDPHTTYGALDFGGASMQIAFVLVLVGEVADLLIGVCEGKHG